MRQIGQSTLIHFPRVTSAAAVFLVLFAITSGNLVFGEKPNASGRIYSQRDHSSWTPYAAPQPPAVVPHEVPLPQPPTGTRWKKTFVDEFDGDSIDQSKWVILGDKPRKTGFWLKNLSRLDGKGNLVITVDRDLDSKTNQMRSIAGGLETNGKFEQAFGYFECRYQMPRDNGSGYHCSFWLQSNTMADVAERGRNGTEIDVIEKFHHDDKIQHCLHWDGYGEHHDRTKCEFPWPGIMDGAHIFALKWTPTQYTFYVDGIETWKTDAGGVSQVPAFVRLTMEFSQGWNGDIASAKLPDQFVVDYVRVYQAVPVRNKH